MAGRSLGSLLIKIGANTYEFQRALETSQKKMQQFSTSLNKMGKSMSLAVTAPLTAIAGVSVHLADVQAKAEAKVEQAIKSTSGAAKLNAEQLKKYASELQGKTLFGDEKILNDVTAQLLTFTNVVGDNFKRAQAVALDLSTVLGSDLKESAIQLGKALNNPVKGLSALSRSGIQFSAEQEEVIKKMATTGRLAEAQAMMLNELERQYGGQAAAAAKVGTGALVQLKNAWGDFLEQIGAAIMPALNLVVKALQGLVNWLQSLSPTTKQVVVVIGGLAAAIGPLLLGLGLMVKAIYVIRTGMTTLRTVVNALVVSFKTLDIATKKSGWAIAISAVIGVVTYAFNEFSSSASNSSNSIEELTQRVVDESIQVNTLVAKLTYANTKESERKKILDELNGINPRIVSGLSAENIELEKLTANAKEYNEQLVLRIAMARKQDQVTAAIEKQTEAGIARAEIESKLYVELADKLTQINTAKLEVGEWNAKQGITRYREVTEQERAKILSEYSSIISGTDDMISKAEKIDAMFTKTSSSTVNIRGLDSSSIRKYIQAYRDAGREVESASEVVANAEKDVKDFAKTFSDALFSEHSGETSVPSITATKIISDLQAARNELRILYSQKSWTEDEQARIEELNGTVSQLTAQYKLLTNVDVTSLSSANGVASQLADRIKEFEDKKSKTFDTGVIAKYNTQIQELQKQQQFLNTVTEKYLQARKNLDNYKPISSMSAYTKLPKYTPFATVFNEVANAQILQRTQQINDLNKLLEKPVHNGMQKWLDETIPLLKKYEVELRKSTSMNAPQVKLPDSPIKGLFNIPSELETRLTIKMKGLENVTGELERLKELMNFTNNDGEKDSLKQRIKLLNEYVVALGGIPAEISLKEKRQKDLNDALGGMSQIMGSLSGVVGEAAGQWLQYASQVLGTLPALIIGIQALGASKSGESVAGVPIVGPILAAAAIATTLAAFASIPKLAKGGLAGAPTLAIVGDNPNAAIDPEVIAPLSKLQRIMQPSAIGGEVVFRIEGRTLVGIINKMNRFNSRT